MDVIKVRALVCSVENKSLSKAAEEFGYTPSAMSHMTDSLENELEIKLLVRTPKGVSLTEQGKELYPKLLSLIDAEDTLLSTAEKICENKAQTLKIGTYSSISLNILPPIIKAFKKKYPNIKVSIKVENSFLGWVKDDKIDIVIADTVAQAGEVSLPIFVDEFVAVLPPNSIANKSTVTAEDLYPYPFISTHESLINHFITENKFRDIIPFDSVDDQTVISMIKEGLGIAILPALVVKKRTKGLQILKLSPTLSRTINVIYKQKDTPTSVKKFIKFINEQKTFKNI